MIFVGKLSTILSSLCIQAVVVAGKNIAFRSSNSCKILCKIIKKYLYHSNLYLQSLF